MKLIPEERKYSHDHGWILMEDDFIGRCGVTDYCQNRLDYIDYIEFPDIDSVFTMGERAAVLESHKDNFILKSPVSGRIVEINQKLEFNPEIINEDPYGEGWIYKIDVKEPREFEELMFEDGYREYITDSGDI